MNAWFGLLRVPVVAGVLASLTLGCGSEKPDQSRVDASWAAWPMPNGSTDVAAGAPHPMAYTVHDDGTVTDRITGLMWQGAVSPTSHPWADAVAACAVLALGGHDDWRAPTEIELISLVDPSAPAGPLVDAAALPETPEGYYWSSVPMADASPNAWLVDFISGSAYDAAVDGPEYVRCVRSPDAAAPTGHYTVAVDTVYDSSTRLTWERSVPDAPLDLPGARAHCASATVAALGGSGWRLPTGKELLTLVDYRVPPPGPAIDAAAFPRTPAAFFWSLSLLSRPVPAAMFVDFAYGHGTNYAVGPTSYVRCVR